MGTVDKAHPHRSLRWLVLIVLLSTLPSAAQQFALAVDVPSNLGGTVYGANQIVQYNSGAGGYSLGTDLSSALGPAGHIAALTEVSPGVYYLAVDVPTTISGTTYQPSDIVKESGGTFGLVQAGSALGIPAGVGIGAITRVPVFDTPVIALTAPATIGGNSYLPGDLLQVSGTTLSLYWSGTSYGHSGGSPPGRRRGDGDQRTPRGSSTSPCPWRAPPSPPERFSSSAAGSSRHRTSMMPASPPGPS